MPLRLSLKPGERIFIGGAVIQNAGEHCELAVLNGAPILREKDILTEDEAQSYCQKLQLCIQLMYMDPANLGLYQKRYRELVDALIAAVPSAVPYVGEINNYLAVGEYYQALKSAKALVAYEHELLEHAKQIP